MSKLLNRELMELKARVVAMADSVRQALEASIAALLQADDGAARAVCAGDAAINEMRFSIENDTIGLIATQQPVAHDVRLLAGIFEIVTELERMGDYAKDIAEIAIRQVASGAPNPPNGLLQMAELAGGMLAQAIKAFSDGDAELAESIAREDDKVDALCWELHRIVLEHAYAGPSEIEEVIRFLPAVHDIERFADRATNICERVVYIETGNQVEYSTRQQS